MDFRVDAEMARSPERVFAFMRDIDQVKRDPHSVVPVLEKISPGPYGVGSTFHEVVRILPFVNADVRSEITRFEPPGVLDYRFEWRCLGATMTGELRYRFEALPGGRTRLVQEQTLVPQGPLAWVSPLIARVFSRRISGRMRGLRAGIESSADSGAAPKDGPLEPDGARPG